MDNKEKRISDGELLQILSALRQRTDIVNATMVQLGFLVEFLYDQLAAQGVEIDMELFPTWAQERQAELQKEMEEAEKAGLMDELKANASSSTNNINLEDTK